MATTYFNIYPTLSPADLASTGNVTGVYFNGPSQNGLKATLTINASTLTLDGIAVVNGNRVLLPRQTNTNENGIYTVSGVGKNVVLTRAPDFQSIEQLLGGQSITVAGGNSLAGGLYSVIEPIPNILGIDPITFIIGSGGTGTAANKDASNNSLPTVASVSGATVLNHILVAADTAGTVKDSNGIRAIAGGDLQVGQPGVSGALTLFPPSANSGRLIIQTPNFGAGNFIARITVEPANQDCSYTFPATSVADNTALVTTDISIAGGNSLVAGPTLGTVLDAGYFIVAKNVTTAGGETSIAFIDPDITNTGILSVTLKTATTAGAYILTSTPDVGLFTVTFNVDPGASTLSYIYISTAT